jgi:hypothetical protein
VHVAWRKDLEQLLNSFVADHRGLSIGRLLGAPSAYAGRKVFACVVNDGITIRLPPDALQTAIDRGGQRWTPIGRRMTGWVIFKPASAQAAASLAPFLEIAARHVALLTLAPAAPARAPAGSRAVLEPGPMTPRAVRPRRCVVPAPRPLRLPKRPR